MRFPTSIFPGVLALVAGAHLSFPLPGTDVPQTGQTLAVLLVGAFAGPLPGTWAVAVYLALGTSGLPVFADGAAGLAVLTGPSGGFLLGFLPAAAAAGGLSRHINETYGGNAQLRRLLLLTVSMLGCHVLMLLCGWVRLATLTGMATAYSAGVAPFLPGAVAKSVLAAVAIALVRGKPRRFGPHIV